MNILRKKVNPKPIWVEESDRNKRVFDAINDGMSFGKAAESFGISKTRAYQIYQAQIKKQKTAL